MPTASLIGSTGLVGSHILSDLLASEAWSAVTTIGRRAPKTSDPAPAKLNTILESDLELWPSKLPSSPASHTVFSALGTTRAAAGGIAAQWKVDHDANVALVKAAKENGVSTFVFVSSGGTRSFLSSMAPYSKMKIGVEDAIKEAGFENAIILRPGLIMGDREQSRSGEGMAQKLVRGLGSLSSGIMDMLGQDAEFIGRAAVRAAEMAAEGKAKDKYWILEAADILKLGRAEPPAKPAEEGK